MDGERAHSVLGGRPRCILHRNAAPFRHHHPSTDRFTLPQMPTDVPATVNELDAFIPNGPAQRSDPSAHAAKTVLDLLMFEFAGDAYAVRAGSVDGVVPWKAPSPVPGAGARVRGVVQDRGRIVTVLSHPAGRATTPSSDPLRIIVCDTPAGLVGLPASATRAVFSAEFATDPVANGVYDLPTGACTFIDAARLDGMESTDDERDAPSARRAGSES
jgi:CheW-like protein